jgi:hypothetical protein
MQDDDYTQILKNVTVNGVKKLVEKYQNMNENGKFYSNKNIHLTVQKKEGGNEESHPKYLVKCEP